MPLTTEQFGKALVASGLMTADELKALWSELPAAKRPKDGESFSAVLLKRGRLNEFQAQELLSGNNTPLILNQYVLLAKIGAGGMGQVFKAQHRKMKRLVAIKLLPSALMKDEAAVKRFQREVEAAAKLLHPNIVAATDADECRGIHYLVMEYVEGQDLSALVKQRGPLPVAEVIDYMAQAARGLAFAHSKGVVHRDIKPANLLLDNEGVVKILDMGLARIEDANAADQQLTNTGAVMGTVDYMAPEQATDTRYADARSDIYSLGCSLYRLLTAQSMFDGDTVVKKIMAHMSAPVPSLRQKCPDAPAELDRIFQKMVAKKPEDRYAKTTDLVVELEALRGGNSSTAVTSAQNSELNSFIQAINTEKPSAPSKSATMSREDGVTEAFGGRPQKSLDITYGSFDGEHQTDPKSEVHLRGSGGGKKPPLKLIAAGAAGVLLVLLGIIVIIKSQSGETLVKVEAPNGSTVVVQPSPATPVKQAASSPGTKAPTVTAATPASEMFKTTKANPLAEPDNRWPFDPTDGRDYAWSEPENFGPTINGPDDELTPSLTADNLRLIYGRRTATLGHYLVEAVRPGAGQPFGPPQLTPGMQPSDPVISSDGLTVAYSVRGDIKLRHRTSFDQPWGEAVDPGPQVNSPQLDNRPTLSPDGLTLLFSADRTPGSQVTNIWISRRSSLAADFSPAQELGPPINTPTNYESKAQLLGDGRMFLVYRSGNWLVVDAEQKNGARGFTLENVPFAKETDTWFTADGRAAYFSADRSGGLGGKDIYVTRRVPKSPALPSSQAPNPVAVVYLDDLKELESAVGFQTLMKHGTSYGRPKLNWRGSPVAHSLWMRPKLNHVSFVRYRLDGQYARFESDAGQIPETNAPPTSPMTFRVLGDGRELWKSKPIDTKDGFDTVSVDVRGVRELRLETTCAGGEHLCEATWYNPRLTPLAPAATANGAQAAPRWPLAPSKPEDITWLQGLKATLTLRSGPTTEVVVKPTDAPPSGPATIVGVACSYDQGPGITDEMLGRVASLVDLETFVCARSQFSPATKNGLPQLAALTNLRHLSLGRVGPPDTDPAFLGSFRQLESLKLHYTAYPGWEQHVARLTSLKKLSLYSMDDVHCEQLQPLPQLTEIELAGYATGRAKRDAAAKQLAGFLPWARIRVRDSKAEENVVIIEPTAPPPGAKARAAAPPAAVFPFDAAQAKSHQEAWAAYLGEPVETTNSVDMKFVVIPPGEFLMGDPTLKHGHVPVTITKPFRFGVHEVTQGQWMAVTGNAAKSDGKSRPGDNFPASCVNWNDAVDFCQKLTAQERAAGRLQADQEYRLPTEAEWELACRAGTVTREFWGAGKNTDYAWFGNNSQNDSGGNSHYPHEVGLKKPNPWGLYDINGNVSEWCSDWWAERLTGGIDPQGPTTGTQRVCTGAACGSPSGSVHSSEHFSKPPEYFTTLGLRVVLTRTGNNAIPAQARPATNGVSTTPSGAAPPPAVFPFDARAALKHQEAWAQYLGVPVEFTNGVGMKFRLIPPGEFQMGLGAEFTDEELIRLTEAKNGQVIKQLLFARPAHPVRITRPFYMEVEEVTSGHYRDVIGQLRAEMEQNPNKPLHIHVTFPDAIAFCNKLSEREGKRPAYRIDREQTTLVDDADGYRLPTEAQWEYACRAGTNTLWYFGNEGGVDHIEFKKRYAAPNPFGLTGLYAGSNEWCWDGIIRDGSPYSAALLSRRDDPREDVGTVRIKRGGSGSDSGGGDRRTINSFARGLSSVSESSNYSGFGRVVLPIAAETK